MNFTPIAGGEGVPPEPDWQQLYVDVLDIALASEQWGKVLRELQDMGTLSMANGHMIERLVLYRVQFERASRQVAEDGPIVKAKRTGVPQIHPCWTVMRQAGEEIRILEVELGIPPTRRGKTTKVVKHKKVERARDAFLKPVAQ
ncbi:P27 family phage terminase small subunit [Aureimonas phyllosphaerae]|uniref:P27 family predicted phage terminase small subunit n=1 Tax=Aureimonas phyllosphaerae TaxID=1166078 RepID=A0A7W6BTF4_9HYPH|nr:P27 family phage terminase small subunit [Aureimonas phyllosphaerae]MBB3937684.1 P27 family predicted phage terminase small subunit [Aureimonas phyllosphaerae]MBB3961781.1 P27 family predicted phage terminase small subunit [Aureimonas phyllosphaerae]SFF45055.1 phage terminase, small subunit, putative, P27 family [Aureimonas phyllosphaerae]